MKAINTLLIANRGEIASRIIRTCRKMGIKSIAVFSDADRHAPFTKQADMAIHLGESSPALSYLDASKIIDAAKRTTADAIHPGYGFLSESSEFAQQCKEAGLIFVGPHIAAIEAMGSKARAKALMQKHGVPVVPGYQGKEQSLEVFLKEAERIGFPLLLKAVAGGGGKGMRIVRKKEELEAALLSAKREALNAFGDEELIIEKYISAGRHIEFQIFGDQHGQTIHLLERECSIQRRYQKVIEESPSPVLDEGMRTKMGAAAVKAAQALKYDNAGTVEFIFDEQQQEFYFLEVNTRLQVEHPVTEEITGLDLVKMQIESAQGLPLSVEQKDVKGKGYAIEVRLYAEDAANSFLPVTGTIERFEVPQVEGLRVETAVQDGSDISVYYDPMIAKLIVWDQNRSTAHRKMQYVLRNLVCLGTTTNQGFLLHILENPEFQEGKYDTHFIEQHSNYTAFLQKQRTGFPLAAIAAILQGWQQREQSRTLLQSLPSGWRNNFYQEQKEIFKYQNELIPVHYRYQQQHFHFEIAEQAFHVLLLATDQHSVRTEINGLQYTFHLTQKGNDYFIQQESLGTFHFRQQDRFPVKEREKIKGGFEATMPSEIIKIMVKAGQEVKAGDGLMVLSSMKMENTIYTNEDGTVAEIYTTEGAHVEAGFLLLKLNEQ